jgi:tetratricopeptide (TPR) repeat protein
MGAILHEAPAPPSSLNPHIAPGLQAVILKSLEKDPSKRFQSARELLADLEQVSSGAAGPAAVAPRRTLATAVRHRALVAGAAVLAVASLIALTVGLNLFGSRDRLFGGNIASQRRAPASAAVHARRSVAVLGFKNLSGREDQAWLSTALSEMLATELAAGGQLRTIPGESVAQMKISLSLPEAESYGKETLSKIRMNLSADDVVVGSYVPLGGDQIRVDLRLQDADVGETLAAVSERGAVSQIDDLVGRAGASLRAKLGVGEVSPAQAAAAKAMFPSDPAAARLYSEGLMKLRAFDNLAARDLLVRAVAAEPTFALAHAALATAWSGLGHDRRAKDEGRQAFDLSKNLGQEGRLWVEGQYREAAGEREKAIEIFRTLFQSYPDNLEYGLRLVNAQALGGKGPDALTAVVALRRLPPPAGDDPRIGLAEALAAESTGDFKREQSAAARAAEKGRALGARLVTASALVYQCWAFQRLGQPNDAVPRCEEARRISEAAGDRHGVAKALNAIAATRLDQGDRAEAKTRFEEALAIARETGAEQSVATLLSNIGLVVWAEGDLDQAQKHFEQSLSISREINADDTASQALGNMGVVSALQGRLSQARARFEDALAIDRRSGVRDRAAIWLWDLGDIAYLQGDLGRANDMLGQAETLARETGRKFVSAGTLNVRGHILAAEDDLAGARRKFEEEQSLQKAMGARTTSNRVDLAALAIEEGQPAQVEATCRQVIQEFRAEKDVDGEILARAVLARALLAASRPTDASQEIAAAAALSARSQDRNLGLTFAIVAARVRAATGSPAEAVRSLEASLAEATTSGFVVHQFDARLALGEIEIRSGKATAGRARLGALEKDATARGFRLVARKAAAARQ